MLRWSCSIASAKTFPREIFQLGDLQLTTKRSVLDVLIVTSSAVYHFRSSPASVYRPEINFEWRAKNGLSLPPPRRPNFRVRIITLSLEQPNILLLFVWVRQTTHAYRVLHRTFADQFLGQSDTFSNTCFENIFLHLTANNQETTDRWHAKLNLKCWDSSRYVYAIVHLLSYINK